MANVAANYAQIHQLFSSGCFNAAWDLLEKTDRTPGEDEQLVLLAHASLWHWTRREDCSAQNLSVGYWQLSRIFAVLKQADNARRAGTQSLAYSEGLDPFYAGYAHEALARAALVANEPATTRTHLAEAQRLAAAIVDEDPQAMLQKDLAELASALPQ